MNNNKNRSAFPLDGNSAGHPDTLGLTKREYFAAMAMQGVLSHNHPGTPTPNQTEDIAKYAIGLADELLKHFEE
jgi:hypothetical protein